MRTCPKCGELNGDNNAHCYKCNTFIGKVGEKKVCTSCGATFQTDSNSCDRCGGRLTLQDTYDLQSKYLKSNNTWMYICTIFIPILGIILGCIKLKEDESLAKSLIILGIVLMIIYAIISGICIGCSAHETADAAREASSYLDEVSSYLRDYN